MKGITILSHDLDDLVIVNQLRRAGISVQGYFHDKRNWEKSINILCIPLVYLAFQSDTPLFIRPEKYLLRDHQSYCFLTERKEIVRYFFRNQAEHDEIRRYELDSLSVPELIAFCGISRPSL